MIKLLLVEADLNLRCELTKIIGGINNNTTIFETANIKEAMIYSSEYDIDIFVLDINLEDGIGIEFALFLRTLNKYKMTPIVFIASMPDKEIMSFKEIHCYDYIIKPYDINRIKKTFQVLLNHGIFKEKKFLLRFIKKDSYIQ